MADFLSLNQDLFFYIFNFSGQNFILDSLMVFGAEYVIFMMIFLALFLSFRKGVKDKKILLLIILSLGVAFILLKTFGKIIDYPRPFVQFPIQPLISHSADDSFPSDHTIILSVIAFSYFYYRSKYTLIFMMGMAVTGLARIFVGVHFPLDIVGGIVLGYCAVYLAGILKNLFTAQMKI